MKKQYWLAAYTIFCWGTLPAVTKLTLTNISNMQVLFISSLIAAGCLYMYLFASGRIRLFHALTGSDVWQLIELGFLGNFLYSAFYYASLRLLPSTDACVINYLWPIVATVCAAVILHEKIEAAEWAAVLLSFAGVAVISTKGSGIALTNMGGILLCIAGAVCYHCRNGRSYPRNPSLYRAAHLLRGDCRQCVRRKQCGCSLRGSSCVSRRAFDFL